MPSMYGKHAVRLQISNDCFNALIAALIINKSSGSDCATDRADALLAKIEKYTRFYSDEDGDCAELRFFESEAKHLIWLLIRAFALHSNDDVDYYSIASNTEQNETAD